MGNPKLGVDLASPDLIATYTGDIKLADDRENVRQAIIRRLNTPLGGLFSHPEYGNPLWDHLSGVMDQSWPSKAEGAIRICLAQEPRITVESVQVTINLETRQAVFNIEYQILDEPRADNLVWSVSV